MKHLILIIFLACFICGCKQAKTSVDLMPTIARSQQSDKLLSTAIPTPTLIPTATPITIAATINNTEIAFSAYEREFAKFQQWYPNGAPNTDDLKLFTINQMIDLELAKQATNQSIEPALVDQHVASTIINSGGQDGFNVWLDQNKFADEQAYRQQIEWELILQSVMKQLSAELPESADYVRARYIEVKTEQTAREVKVQLDRGMAFNDMVQQYSIDPYKAQLNGDLGMFRQDTLLVPEIDKVAFTLGINEISDVIISPVKNGYTRYFIIQTIERKNALSLSSQERAALLQSSYDNWLIEQKKTAVITTWLDAEEK